MTKSEGKLPILGALLRAKKKFGVVNKGAVNPRFEKSYADLGDILGAVEEALHEEDVLILQPMSSEEGTTVISTILWHVPSESRVQSSAVIDPGKGGPQEFGKCVTYYRRYTLQSLLGLVAEDDDGNSASVMSSGRPAAKSVDIEL